MNFGKEKRKKKNEIEVSKIFSFGNLKNGKGWREEKEKEGNVGNGRQNVT